MNVDFFLPLVGLLQNNLNKSLVNVVTQALLIIYFSK